MNEKNERKTKWTNEWANKQMNEPMCPEFERQYHVVYPRVGDSFDDLIFPPLSLLGRMADKQWRYDLPNWPLLQYVLLGF